jgi:glycosyltransferase involved in cell wall biosynthesis
VGATISLVQKRHNKVDFHATYAAVIPVYNSVAVIGETLCRTEETFQRYGLDYKIIAVNDGSTDASWLILQTLAAHNPRIIAINLVRNYGQHAALMCGLQHSNADYVITLDDDLQNPPEEMIRLIEKAAEGFDLVCGRYHQKKHAFYRRVGSKLVNAVNERVFAKPPDFSLTNYRLLRRSLVERICAYRTPFPYINGLAVNLAGSMANVGIDHRERKSGKSTYTMGKILKLVCTILFNYSSFPLRFVCAAGLLVSVLSFIFAALMVARALLLGVNVPGWTSIVVAMSFYGGFQVLMLGMLGEYVIRILGTTADQRCYHIKEKIND